MASCTGAALHCGSQSRSTGCSLFSLHTSLGSFLRHQPVNFFPASPVGMLLYHGVGPVFWAIVILAAIRPIIENPAKELASGTARARAMLTQGGGDALGFMTTWSGNSYWFDPVG